MWNLSSWDILRVSALSIIRLVKYLSLENDFTRQISLWEAEIIFGLRWMVWDIRNAEFFNQLRYLKGLPTSNKQINPNNISSLPITNTFTLYDRINYLKWRGMSKSWINDRAVIFDGSWHWMIGRIDRIEWIDLLQVITCIKNSANQILNYVIKRSLYMINECTKSF